jgi:hypothetical protein
MFYRPNDSDAGLAPIWHSYFIVASDWQPGGAGAAIATVIPLTVDTPELSPAHLIVKSGGPVKALSEAKRSVEAMPLNAGLQQLSDCPEE